MPPLTDNTTAILNGTDAETDSTRPNAKRNQVVLQVSASSGGPSPFEDFDDPPDRQKAIQPSPPGRARPTPRVQEPQSAAYPTPTPTAAARLEPPSYPELQPVKRSPSVSYNAIAPPLPRATPPPTPVEIRWDPGAGQAPPQPTPTASPNATQHHHCNHPDNCPCPGPTCVTQTDIVWVHNVTTYAAPNPQPTPTSICATVEQTSVYWETQQGVWLTTVFPVMSTYWVWEKIPHTVHSLSTSFSETFVPGPQPCPLPPPDWCEDGWIDGVWHGEGDAPCWYGHHHHWHWPGAHDVFGTLGPDQIATLIAIPIILAVILVLWSVHVLAVIFLLPFQLFTNFIHEISHVIAGVIGGAKICSVTIDPGCGPLSTMRNGSPAFTLLSGYTGSLLFGWGIVTCAFDEKASKITYIITAPVWLPAAWFTVGFWPKLQIAIVIGWSIALWYIWEGRLLRFYMLFLGLMSVMYVLWDCLDDFIFKKQNESDASLLSRLYPSVAPGTWGFIFMVISLGVLACACVSGLHWFQGPRHVYSEDFLPT